MSRRHKSFPGLTKIMVEIDKNYRGITMEESTSKSGSFDCKPLVERIVDSIENRASFDKQAYDQLVKKHPLVRKILDDLIHQVRLYAIYDDEPHQVNFNYSAYLKQIDRLVNI